MWRQRLRTTQNPVANKGAVDRLQWFALRTQDGSLLNCTRDSTFKYIKALEVEG